ncbi:aspartate aminotransferase family protein [Dactylosporangium sp. CA-092794]|uniref:aspartate aminotransferase family protein n=1 Tax=Dactylosporangium sp. CA-092794 TaxID=3239929 RepID=UPI003D8EE478
MPTGTGAAAALPAALDIVERGFAEANPRSAGQYRSALAVLPGGNTRTTLYYSPFPVVFTEGEGQHLTDLDGHVYTDFLGEYSAGLYGHSHPVIMGAARAALERGMALGGPNTYEAELAGLIERRYPSVELLRFTNSGTEANLMALATARVCTGRTHTLVFDGCYHGSVLSYRGESPINAPFPVVVSRYNDIDTTVALIERHRHDLAAVILEPLLGGGGVIAAAPEFLHAVREVTTRHGIVLILDEVMTSRLAPGGLQGVHGVRPDLTTFGKYLGGGFSFGAFGGARDLMGRYDPASNGAITHPGTFNNNVLSMAAGAAGLREVFTPDVVVAHNARGDDLRRAMNDVFASARVEMSATGVGSLIGIHFQTTPIARPDDVRPATQQRALLHLEMMARGYYFARRGYLALPLPLTAGDLDGFVAALGDVVAEHAHLLRSRS